MATIEHDFSGEWDCTLDEAGEVPNWPCAHELEWCSFCGIAVSELIRYAEQLISIWLCEVDDQLCPGIAPDYRRFVHALVDRLAELVDVAERGNPEPLRVTLYVETRR